jgi:hypothetical protein
MGLLYALIVLVLLVLWVWQFVQLMLLEDDLFPGRNDKALWVAAFVVVLPLTPVAFMLWKRARLEAAREQVR